MLSKPTYGSRHRPRRHRHAERGRTQTRRTRPHSARSQARTSSAKSGTGKEYSTVASPPQQRRMGISCDWQRALPLDDGLSDAVLDTFIRLYERRADIPRQLPGQLVSPLHQRHQRPEVEYEEVHGSFYTFRYPLKEKAASSRSAPPAETILGDTAVAVHPDDDRYRDVVGKTTIVPILGARSRSSPTSTSIPPSAPALEGDPRSRSQRLRDRQAASPAAVNIMNQDATLNDEAGLRRPRPLRNVKMWQDMEEASLTINVEERAHQVDCTASAAIPSSSPCSASNGGCAPRHWPNFLRYRPCVAPSRSCPSASKRSIFTGWRTSATGASAANCGGAIASHLVRTRR